MPRKGPQVLGVDLNCSEEASGGLPLNDACAGTRFTYSCQASTEHFEQCAEFALLPNRGFYDGLSIDEPSLSARVTSIQPASLRSLARCALPYSHGRKRLAE
jgi:hypothetical protein